MDEMSHNDNAVCWDSKENKVCFIFTFDEPPKGRKAWNRAIVNFVLITLGSGMGSCFFSNGVAHQGNDGMGGEVGHTCVALDGRQCGCGNHGCLETYTGARGIVQTARELMSETTEPSLMRGVEGLTPKMITAFCEQGDKLAQEVYRRTGEVLGMGLALYVEKWSRNK